MKKKNTDAASVRQKASKGDAIKILGRLLTYMAPCRLRLVIVMICMIVGSVCSARAVYYMKPLINDCIVPLIGQKSPDFTAFYRTLTLMAGLYLVSVLASLLQGIIMTGVSNEVLCRVRSDMFRVMEHFPLSYFDRHSRGQIMSYYSNDVDALSNMLRQSIPRIVEGITGILTILITIFTVNLRMALVVTVCVAVNALALTLLSGNKSKLYAGQQQCMQELNAYGEEMISGRAEIKAFSREETVSAHFSEINGRLFDFVNRTDFFANSMFDFTSGLNNLGFAAVAICGCVMALHGLTDPGTVGVFLQYYKKLNTPVTRIAKQVSNTFEALAGAGRIFDFLDTPPEEDEGQVTLVSCTQDAEGNPTECETRTGTYAWKLPSGELRPCRGALVFSHVDFGYVEGVPVLKDLSFEVLPRQTVAFVGTTGAGKTTILNLLSRFYEISSGSITFDGIDIRSIRKEALRRAAGVVLQDTHLFTGTVAENIRYGYPEADMDEVKAAAGVARADYFIELMKTGYGTPLTHDGASLSQGERQLLAIARAAVGKYPVLVLDEATSSIDSRMEQLVSQGLDDLTKDRTVLVVAHRLSTIQGADKIIVLDKGGIAEAGDHKSLIEKKGLYYRLYTGAAGAA
ncbi:MAG: ABC transporter ATP-binding protein [Candidatus Limivicinus sp.]